MRVIAKGPEPASLTVHRQTPHSDYGQLHGQGRSPARTSQRAAWTVLLLHGSHSRRPH